ncbi:MAG: N-acetyltransferase family protein [Candidatus Sumerlaeota bacterium]
MTLEDVTIRNATRDDLDALVALLSSLFSIEADFAVDFEQQRRGLEMMLARPDERWVMVAETDGRVVGMVTLQLLISTAQGGPVGFVEDMVIDENVRGMGVGRILLSAMEARAGEAGLSRLQLLADRENEGALRFYERAGWEETQLICRRKFPEA